MRTKLFFLTAALLTCLSASAQSFTADWKKPVPTQFSNWEPETDFYLYNVGAGGFYIAYQGGTPNDGRYWQTRSSVNDTIGAVVRFSHENPDPNFEDYDLTEEDNVWLFLNYVPKFNEFRCSFSEGRYNSVWTDNNRDHDRAWNVIVSTDGTLKLQIDNGFAYSDYDYEGKYLGVLPSDPDGVLYLEDRDVIGDDALFYNTWRVLSPEQYESFIASSKNDIKRAAAAASLRAAIEAAQKENPTIDYSRQIAVYNNTSSSLEELQAAEESLLGSLIDILVQGASVTNPADLTQIIQNPTFDGMNYDGWKGDAFSAGGDVDEVAEHFNKNFDTYQTISGLPAGVYEVRVNGFYRAGDSPSADYDAVRRGRPSNARLYITGGTLGEFNVPIKHLTEKGLTEALGLPRGGMDTEVSLTTDEGTMWLPNTMVGANAYFHLEDNPTLYRSNIAGAISDGDVLRFGVKKTTGIANDWSIFDDFQLLYYGNSTDAYQVIIENVLNTNKLDLTADGVFYGQPEYEAYNEVLQALENAASPEEIISNLPQLEETRATLSASIDAYTAYIEEVNKALLWLDTFEGTGTYLDLISEYLEGNPAQGEFPNGNLRYIIPDYDDNNGAGKLSTEQINAEITYLQELREKAIRGSLYDGTDLTDLIKNPGFELGGASGWLTDPQYNGGNVTNWHGGTAPNFCAEAFNHNFDIYQVIEGLENGLYEVNVQAFYRTAANSAAFNAYKYKTGEETVLSEVYLNDFSTPVKNVMEIQFAENLANNCWMNDDGFYTLDGMASASAAFSLTDETQNFTQRVYGLVTNGTLRLGIRNTKGTLDARWTLFDNFHLTFRAKNINALQEVIDNYGERTDILNGEDYGRQESRALNTALANADNAQGSDAKYDALLKLVSAYNEAKECVDAYKKLNDALDLLNEALLEAALDNPSSRAYNDAADFYDETSEAISNLDLNTSEALKAVEDINGWISKLRVPDYEGAADSNPIDMTNTIVNPNFDIVNDFTGWLGTAFGTGGDAGQNAEHYEHNFDSYQDIYGLPAGTYELSVKGMYRHGSPSNDFNVFKQAQAEKEADPDYVDPTQLAYLYAQTASKTIIALIDHTCDGGKSQPDFSATNAGTADEPCYVADSRTSADLYFHDDEAPDAYLTSVIIKIEEGDVLRIGVAKSGDVPAQAWAIFDDFTLTYFGPDSSKQEGDNQVSVESIKLPQTLTIAGIYSIDGKQLNALQRGVNIVRMADGRVQKIIVK